MDNKDNVKFADKVADKLRKAAVELEEFQLQAALGKAEAENKYEEAKKKFHSVIHETKVSADTNLEAGKEKIDEVNAKIDQLKVQLALGKADTLDAFKEQKRKILDAAHELEVKIKTNDKLNRAYTYTLIELDMFKVQLEILEDKFQEGKKDVKDAFNRGKEKLNSFIDKLKAESDEDKIESRWEHFQDEMSDAFSHLRNAFSK
jgi:hypothetical protein